MTMQLTVESPAIPQGVAVWGGAASFELKSATETSVVTSIQQK